MFLKDKTGFEPTHCGADERLPLLARDLKKGTKKVKGKKATDSQLFVFAQEKDWKSKLNGGTLERVAALIDDYERCLKHIRSCRPPISTAISAPRCSAKRF